METFSNPTTADPATVPIFVEGEPAIAVSKESTFPAGATDAGARLDARQAADQHWREERKESLLRRLRRVHRAGTAGRWMCVGAALAQLPVWASTLILRWAEPSDSLADIVRWLGRSSLFGAVGLCVLGALAAFVCDHLQRGLLKVAAREGMEVPPASSSTEAVMEPAPPLGQSRESPTADRQFQIDRADMHSRATRGVCLFGAYIFLLACPLFIFYRSQQEFPVMAPGGFLKAFLEFVLMLALVIVLTAPVPALASVWAWVRRRHLALEAAHEGLDVKPPPSSPWG